MSDTVGSIESNEIDGLVLLTLRLLKPLQRKFRRQLRERLGVVNRLFAHRLFSDLGMDFFPVNHFPSIWDSRTEQALTDDVRHWVVELAKNKGGYQGDYTEDPYAAEVYRHVSEAPSVDALLDGAYDVPFPHISGHLRPEKFNEWFNQGSETVEELAFDAANYVLDIGRFSAFYLDAAKAAIEGDEAEWDADELADFIEARFADMDMALLETAPENPVNVWAEKGLEFLAKLDGVLAEYERGRADADRLIRQTFALPSTREPGMVWLRSYWANPLQAVQAVFVFTESFYAPFEEDEGDSILESLRVAFERGD